MTNFEIWLLALCLAIDCFTVAIASGCILKRFDRSIMLKMAFMFGLFQALMPLIGWLATSHFSQEIKAYDHWIAFGLLSFLGIKMIKEYFKKDCDTRRFDPSRKRVIFALAIATSIDALAVGITFAFTGYTSLSSLAFPLSAIGVMSFVMPLIGYTLGVFFGKKMHLPFEVIGGVVLIGIGIRVLIAHSDHIPLFQTF